MKTKIIDNKEMVVTNCFKIKYLSNACEFVKYLEHEKIEVKIYIDYEGLEEFAFFAYDIENHNKLELLLNYFFSNLK